MLHCLKYILLVLLIVAGLPSLEAQFCRNYEQSCAEPPDEFVNNSVARSFSLGKNQTVNFNQILYGGRSYYISVCGEKDLGKIEFRLLTDDEDRTVLYSNATGGYISEQTFQIENSIKLIIEILAPEYDVSDNLRCAGLRIFYK